MQALELKAHLTYLTLAGYEEGEYVWIGEKRDWDKVSWFMDCGGELKEDEWDKDVYYGNK